ncbi:MAG: YraN family protein [Parcubacteria group bacterium]|nr:YraN family protein [Parcubacteria group bacterium]
MNYDIGKLGENIACKFLENKGFHVKTRNYRRIFGELDIVAEYKNKLHFVEVKTLEGENTLFKPEDAVNHRKRERLKRAIKGYLREICVSDETEWQFDIISVLVNTDDKIARVRVLENMVL